MTHTAETAAKWVPEWAADTLVFANPRALGTKYCKEALDEFDQLLELVRSHEVVAYVLGNNERDTPSIWARDFAPLDAGDRLVGFRYQPPYAPEEWDDVVTGRFRTIVEEVIGKKITPSDLTLECGNIVTDGHTSISTERLHKSNGGDDHVRTQLQALGISRVVYIPLEEGDKVGHSDGMIRFVEPGAVLMNDYTGGDRQFGEALRRTIPGDIRIVGHIPYHPTSAATKGVPPAKGCYINYLQAGRLVVVPTFGTRHDEAAREAIAAHLPGHVVLSSPAEAIACEGGVFRCICAHYRVSGSPHGSAPAPGI